MCLGGFNWMSLSRFGIPNTNNTSACDSSHDQEKSPDNDTQLPYNKSIITVICGDLTLLSLCLISKISDV